jgi:cytochrome c-type biogenesis protein CcmH
MSTTPSPLRGTPPAKWPREKKNTLSLTRSVGEYRAAGRGCLSILMFATLLTLPALAVQPDEILKDPVLEARARSISAGLRCMVCQNQSIDDSDATVARDLRILIREQLQQKRTDTEVVDFVVSRYGEYVLLKPRFKSSTLLLWASPFLILLAGLAFAFRRKPVSAPDALTAAEKAEIDALMLK